MMARSSDWPVEKRAGVKEGAEPMYATCSGFNCNLLGTGLSSTPPIDLVNPVAPDPSDNSVLINNKYVLQVARMYLPFSVVSTPKIGSPNMGRRVLARLSSLLKSLNSPLADATANYPDPVVAPQMKSFFTA